MRSFAMIVGSLVLVLPMHGACAAVDLEAEVTRLASPVIEGGIVPGMVVGVLTGGESHVFSFGSLRPGGDEAPDERTIYEIGSITKAFTGILFADAIAREELTLEDELGKHMPEGIAPPKRDGKQITLRHLATHTSSLPRLPANFQPADAGDPFKDYGRDALWSFLDGMRPACAIGSQYEYSNLAVGLLGTIIAGRAGAPYTELLRTRISEPLGLVDTAVVLTETQRERLAPGYTSGIMPVANWEWDALVGAGGIRSTMHDMLILARAGLDALGSDGEGGRPIDAAIAYSMECRYTLPANAGGNPEAGTGAGIGLAWNIARDGTSVWHNGQTGGYHSYFVIDPVHNNAVVVLANANGMVIDEVGGGIIRVLAGIPAEAPGVRVAVNVSASALEKLVGEYQSALGFSIVVTHDRLGQIDDKAGGVLLARVTNQLPLRLWPESETLYFYRDVPAEIEFSIDEGADKPAHLMLFQNGAEYVCERVGE